MHTPKRSLSSQLDLEGGSNKTTGAQGRPIGGCCSDLTSTDINPLVQKAIRILSITGLILTVIEFGVGGAAYEFFAPPKDAVRVGCWWVGLVLFWASLCGAVCKNKGFVMVCAVLSVVGVPIAIGGAGADGQAFARFTSRPFGCAQLKPKESSLLAIYTTQTLTLPQSPALTYGRHTLSRAPSAHLATSPLLADLPATARRLDSLSSSSSSSSSSKAAAPPVIAYGTPGSSAQQAVATQCLLLAYAAGAVSRSNCFCTHEYAPATGRLGGTGGAEGSGCRV